jgi:cytochrome c oxidase assembly factor CtaG
VTEDPPARKVGLVHQLPMVGTDGHPVRCRLLAASGVVLSLAAILPPVATYAGQYAFVQALQFAVFAVITPALLTLGISPNAVVPQGPDDEGSRARVSAARVAGSRLLPFMLIVIIWRLPAVLDALVRYPALSLAELVTLVAAGLGVWLVIAGMTAPGPLPRPLRAAMAAAVTWTIWIIAYVTGMSSVALIPRTASAVASLGSATDRQLAVGILWAVPAICFAPPIYYLLMSWLGERDMLDDHHGGELTSPEAGNLVPTHRPPSGWRHRGAR